MHRAGPAMVAVCAALLGAAACGSGTDSQTVPGPAGPAATGARPGPNVSGHSGPRPPVRANPASTPKPAHPRTTGPGSETAAFTQTVLPASTPISSAQYHDAVVKAVQSAGKSPKTGEVIASCVQKILADAGITTVGQAAKLKQHPTANKRVADGALQCLGSAAP
jgi:hypothetical protein